MAIENRTVPCSIVVIYTRRELLGQATFPGPEFRRLEAALSKLIDSICQEVEAGHLGRNEVISVSTTSHTLQADVEFVISVVYRSL